MADISGGERSVKTIIKLEVITEQHKMVQILESDKEGEE